jgi:hypothetical protein
MRHLALAVAAASLTLPVAMPAPAEAQGYYTGKTWRDSQGRLRCRRRHGTAGRGDRTIGTVLGGAAGALLGREVDKSRGFRCR